jgi:uncharacterized surface protein with fasciclin (FAS1) repeats
MTTRFARLAAGIAAVSLLAAACGDDSDDADTEPTTAPVEATTAPPTSPAEAPPTTEAAMTEEADIVDTAIAAGDFTTLVAAVQAAGLEATLRGDGPFTVFAPTDAAFQTYLGEMGMTADDVLADPAALTALLQAHVVAGDDDSAMVMSMADQSFTTLAGTPLAVTVDGDTTMVGNATIVEYDLAASNGTVHVIDAVLAPAG